MRAKVMKLGERAGAVAGSLCFDSPRLAWPILTPILRSKWSLFHNRREQLLPGPGGRGFDCGWEWTSDLTIARVLPSAGRRLLRAALADWPIRFGPARVGRDSVRPEVSFVIGHRGTARLPLLLKTLSSLEAQTGCSVEIVVVEQAADPVLAGKLASGVRLIHQIPPRPEMAYSRSWAFNRGVEEARGRVVILHDNDVLAPAGYASEALRLVDAGYEALRLQRYVFYADAESTARLLEKDSAESRIWGNCSLEYVRQNCQGHSIALTRDAYLRIGGHDEGFVGWGGEDNEFFDRCRLLRFHPWGYLPFVHLWHPPQPEKARPENRGNRLDEMRTIPAAERVRRLRCAIDRAQSGAESSPGMLGRCADRIPENQATAGR